MKKITLLTITLLCFAINSIAQRMVGISDAYSAGEFDGKSNNKITSQANYFEVTDKGVKMNGTMYHFTQSLEFFSKSDALLIYVSTVIDPVSYEGYVVFLTRHFEGEAKYSISFVDDTGFGLVYFFKEIRVYEK